MINRIPATVGVLATLLLAACSGETNLPEASGKGIIRAINAMPASPDIRFLIEERAIDTIGYTESSGAVRYDDLEYTFNIEVRFAGEASPRRVASQFIDVLADTEYTLLVSGEVASPAITLWEKPVRTFDEGGTVFEVRFAHAAASADAVDFFFAPADVAPSAGEQAATLSLGEVSGAADYPGGAYVLTVTAAGDPDAVLFVSDPTVFAPGDAVLIMPFDGVATDNAPVVVRAFSDAGGAIALTDNRFAPSVEFINAALDLGAVDIYADETLTVPIVAGLGFGEVSAEVTAEAGDNGFYFTSAGDTGVVLLEGTLPALGSIRYRTVAAGVAGSFSAISTIPSRRSVQTEARLSTLHASNNFETLAVYALEPGETPDGNSPVQAASRFEQANVAALAPGSYELYVTEFGLDQILAGPYAVDVSVGDIIDIIILDAVDPAVVDVLFLSGGPAP